MGDKILVGMSGGVDSSVAVNVLRSRGFSPIGMYLDMKHGNDEAPVRIASESDANSNEDLLSALQCAEKNSVELYKMGCEEIFRKCVIKYFTEEYLAGRTPNPCTVCNRTVKFERLLAAADMLGCKKVATGHYARIAADEVTGRFYVKKGLDPRKDQSYMLWKLSQAQLSRLIFPLGDHVKTDVFKTAEKEGYIAADRDESLDICFLPDGVSYPEFIEERFGKCPEGDFISPDGEVCGRHKGIIHYTVGQRKGLGVALGEPVFILRIDKETNRIYLGKKSDEGTDTFNADGINFMKLSSSESFAGEFDVKIRYAASPVKAHVSFENGILTVTTAEKVRAVTPGQSLVAYDGDDVMFGAVIR